MTSAYFAARPDGPRCASEAASILRAERADRGGDLPRAGLELAALSLEERRGELAHRHAPGDETLDVALVEPTVLHEVADRFPPGRDDHVVEATDVVVHDRVDRMRALRAARGFPERSLALVFHYVDEGHVLLEGDDRRALPGPHAHLELESLLHEDDLLHEHFPRRLDGETDKIRAEVLELAEKVERGAHHLELDFDLERGPRPDAVENVDSPARRGEVHVLAVPHLDVNPVRPAGLELLDRSPEVAVVRPEESSCDLRLPGHPADLFLCCSHCPLSRPKG